MIFVDSSVWIDYFRGRPTAESERLDSLLGDSEIVVGDIVMTEVLQGFDQDLEFETALKLLGNFTIAEVSGAANAIEAARNYRRLRLLGVTVRKTIDTLIATCCIRAGYALLHSDRDFDPFALHLGLRIA